MPLQPITLAQLQAILQQCITATAQARPVTAAIFQLMYDTGLRINEVLDVTRWTATDDDFYVVQLEKGEGTRTFPVGIVPPLIEQNYASSTPYVYETYSAVNNTFKYYAPGVMFGNNQRPSTCHCFRYQYIKNLAQEGFSVSEISTIMGHVNPANTAQYIQDTIFST